MLNQNLRTYPYRTVSNTGNLARHSCFQGPHIIAMAVCHDKGLNEDGLPPSTDWVT
jgi:hypothetical protein